MARGYAAAFLDNHFRLDLDIKGSHFATQTFWHQVELYFLLGNMERIGFKEEIQNFLVFVTECTQQDRRRQFAASVNTYKHGILGVKFHVQPGAAVGNNPRREQQLAGGMGLALVVIKEDTRRTVQLRHDDTLGTVDHKGTIVRHQGQFAHVDFLFLDVLDLLGVGR